MHAMRDKAHVQVPFIQQLKDFMLMKLCMTSVMTASQCILLKKAYALHVTLAKAAIVVKEETVAAQDPTPATVATVHVKAATAAKAVIPVRVAIAVKVVLQVRVVVLVGALMEHVSLLTALVEQ